MKRNFHARKFRQLKNTVARLQALLKSENLTRRETLIQVLKNKINHLLRELSFSFSRYRLQKVLAGVALLLAGLAPQQATAQHYDPNVTSAFGISPTDQLVDLDADGDLDILVSNKQYGYWQYGYGGYSYYIPGFHKLFYRINTVVNGESSFGNWNEIVHIDYVTCDMLSSLADIDGDGDLDLVNYKKNGYISDLTYIINTGTPSTPNFGFNSEVQIVNGISWNNVAPMLRDLDGDSDLDIFLGYDTGLTLFENTGTAEAPNFQSTEVHNPYDLPIDYGVRKLLIDIDQDGDFDFITGNNNAMVMHENIGSSTNPSFSAAINDPFGLVLTNLASSNGQFIDFDGDSDLDFLTAGITSSLRYHENTGTGTPSFGAAILEPFCVNFATAYSNLFIGDLEGDSDLDLFASTTVALDYYENNPLGTTYYRDFDGDSWGDLQNPLVSSSCSIPAGYVFNSADCNDADAAVYYEKNWYQDSDGDSYGNGSQSMWACSQPIGYVADWGDCDDNNAAFHTSAYLFTDADLDGFGDANLSYTYTCLGAPGFSSNNLDCDDSNPNISPIALDIPNNGIDENCDGTQNIFVGLGELSTDHFSLYPNPGTDQVRIISGIDLNEIQSITCHSIDGSKIRLESLSDLVKGDVIELNTKNWNSGIYILSIQVKDQVINLKWVKN